MTFPGSTHGSGFQGRSCISQSRGLTADPWIRPPAADSLLLPVATFATFSCCCSVTAARGQIADPLERSHLPSEPPFFNQKVAEERTLSSLSERAS